MQSSTLPQARRGDIAQSACSVPDSAPAESAPDGSATLPAPGFQALAAAYAGAVPDWRLPPRPIVFRGLAACWPAVQQWTFSRLAAQVPSQSVRLVAGNRECGATRFVDSTLRQYLDSLGASVPAELQALYLKEFDLLKAAPELRGDLKYADLFPKGALRALQCWIGPAAARTGLHYDYLDNLAVQIIGRKRFFLARPGTVERYGAVSRKYDSWAKLSMLQAEDLAAGAGADSDLFSVDLAPGDVLYMPAGWWHQVSNLTPSLMFGGFYGRPWRVLARWAWVRSRDLLHRSGGLAAGDCTCHPQS